MSLFEKYPLKYKERSFCVAVAQPHDKETLITLRNAIDYKVVTKAILVGDTKIIQTILTNEQITLDSIEYVNVEDANESALLTAKLVHDGLADVPMKGMIESSTFLKAMLSKELNLRTGNKLSHVMFMHRESDDFTLIATDAGMNIAPDITDKVSIVNNAVQLAHALQIGNPVVVPLTAKEKVYDKMPATVDADQLRSMNLEGVIQGCQISGPLQFDLAISKQSAVMKQCKDPHAGNADILLMPSIEAGNIFVKSMTYLAGFNGYGIIMGSRTPMILVSRSEGVKEKLGSLYLARLVNELSIL